MLSTSKDQVKNAHLYVTSLTCSEYLNNDIKNRGNFKEVLTKPEKWQLLRACRSFLWMPHRKFLWGKKKKQTNLSKEKKKLHKGKKKQCTSLPVRHSRKCDFSVYLCSIRGSTAAPSSSERAAQEERESRNITGISVWFSLLLQCFKIKKKKKKLKQSSKIPVSNNELTSL